MKYYIATSLTRILQHNIVSDFLREIGHTLSYDWTVHGNVKSTSKERLREVCINELDGIKASEYVLVLLPGGPGTHVELGYALGSGKKVILHSEDPLLFELGSQTCAFYHHPEVTHLCCSIEEVGERVRMLMEKCYI